MGDQQHRVPVVGETAEEAHELAFHAGVQPGGSLVEEEQARVRQQFSADRNAFSLPPAEPRDLHAGLIAQAEDGQHLIHPRTPLRGRRVFRQTKLGGVTERALDRQFLVQDVLLGDEAEGGSKGVEIPVEVPAVDQYRAAGCRPKAAQRPEQG